MKSADEWRQWDKEELNDFQEEFILLVFMTLAPTVVGVLVCARYRLGYEVLPFFMAGPWALFKLFEFLRRPTKALGD